MNKNSFLFLMFVYVVVITFLLVVIPVYYIATTSLSFWIIVPCGLMFELALTVINDFQKIYEKE